MEKEKKEVEYQNIEKIFNTKYYIDFYQRDYTWKQENVEILIEDIFHRFEMSYNEEIDATTKSIKENYKKYFLNTFIINEQDGRVCLVDGQQRFSTLSLILIRLHKIAVSRELSDTRIQSIREKICKTTSDGLDFWMGGNNRDKTFEEIFKNGERVELNRKLSYSEENLFDRYDVVKRKIDEKIAPFGDSKHYIDSFIIYFLNCVRMVKIIIEDADDVPMVFEVINAKGEKLKSHEILKSQLLSKFPKEEVETNLVVWNLFTDFIRKIEVKYDRIDDSIDSFFTFLFKSRYTRDINEIKKFKDYHKTILSRNWNGRFLYNDKKYITKFIQEEISFYMSLIKDIKEKSETYNQEYKHLYFNGSKVNAIQNNQYSLLISCIKINDEKKDDKIKLISKLLDRHFSVLRLQQSYESNTFNTSCNDLVLKLRNNDNLGEIQKVFDEELIKQIRNYKDNEAINDYLSYSYFKNLSLTTGNKTFIRYALARVEDFISIESEITSDTFTRLITGRNYNIEHILSRNEENVAVFKNIDFFNEQRERIGALLLIVGGDNNLSSNEVYFKKLSTYENGTIWAKSLTQNFYHNNQRINLFKTKYPNIDLTPFAKFDENTLELRQKTLFELIKIIWN